VEARVATIDAYNTAHLDALTPALENGQVALIVGAGTSIACGYPGWGAFLGALERPLRAEFGDVYVEKLKVERPDFLPRLDKMVQLLGDQWPTIFRETFAPRGTGEDAPEWIRLLFDLNARLILTTNYTEELEQVASFHPSAPLGRDATPVRWWDAKRLDDAMRRSRGRAELVYIHGRHDDDPALRSDDRGPRWSRIVLGEASYQHAYENSGPVGRALEAVARTHTLLFVGSSLADDDMRGVIRGVKAAVGPGGAPHYAVLGLDETRAPAGDAEVSVERYGLRPLYYPVRRDAAGMPDHSALEALLRELARRASPSRPAVKTVAVPASPLAYPPKPRVVHQLLAAPDFEPRPEYEMPVLDFLNGNGGVLALVGVGGSGKTVIVQRAVADAKARAPDGLFVWSFYEEPSAPAFLRSLAGYLLGVELAEETSGAAAYESIRRVLLDAPATRLVVVLDGLEKLQRERDDAGDGHYGALDDQPLRQLLLALAGNELGARAIVTTRFPLADLDEVEDDERVVFLELDALTRAQARRLLRRRDVRGDDRELDEVLDRFGAHALTVDHLASVLVFVAGGEAHRWPELGLGPLTRFQVGETGKRLAKVLAAYQAYLAREEPVVRATLEAVAVFARPVSVGLLTRVFLDPKRAARAGNLAGRTEADVRKALGRLKDLRLLHQESLGPGVEPDWTLHPAVRDAVLDALGTARAARSGAAAEALREEVDRVSGGPGVQPTTTEALDHIEETIGLCIDAGEMEAAFELYWYRLGSYRHLGWILGDYARGTRVCRRLVAATADEGKLDRKRYDLLVTALGLFLSESGAIDESRRWSIANADPLRRRGQPEGQSTAFRNASDVERLAGHLSSAEALAQSAWGSAEEADDDEQRANSAYYRAAIRSERGVLTAALRDFAEGCRLESDSTSNTAMIYSLSGIDCMRLLFRLERVALAERLGKAAQSIHVRNRWADSIARTRVLLASAAHWRGDDAAARAELVAARDWALQSGHQQCLIEARLVGARIALDGGDPLAARREADEALSSARTCGFGLLEIDARTLVSEVALAQGDAQTARKEADRALAKSDDPQCDYFWGRLAAHKRLDAALTALGDHVEALRHRRRAEALRATTQVDEKLFDPLLPKDDGPTKAAAR
jgi:hypothetical protein